MIVYGIGKIVNDLFKWQTLKKPELVQLDKVSYRWFTSMHSWAYKVWKSAIYYDKIMSKITDKCTFFASSKKNSL